MSIKKFISIFSIIFIIISISLVFASTFQTLTVVNPTSFSNVSGTITLNASSNLTNSAFVNATFSFIDTNGATSLSSIIFNTSVNAVSLENLTFDTTLLSDGQYNLSVIGYNSTGSSITNTSVVNVTVDNTPPTVTSTAPANQLFDITSGNQTFSARVTDALTNVQQVIFMFDNASTNTYAPGNIFNITAVNNSGVWNFSQNVSAFQAGNHVVTVFAQDYAGTVSQSIAINFSVNTAPNVTLNNLATSYFNVSSGNFLINATVLNRTSINPIDFVVFQFDNASGNDFNITQTLSQATQGKYFNFTYNISSLPEGIHTLTIFANDTVGNINQSQSITFYVDNSAPSASVTCSPSPVSSGQTVTCSCTGSDSISGVSTAVFSDGLPSELISTSSTGTKSSSTCTVTDNSGNVATATGSYSVSSSGGSGGGGSGGGFTTSIANAYQQKTWNSIYKDETAKFELKNAESGVTAVSILVKETIYGVWIRVAKKDSLPSNVQQLGSLVYRNLEITTSRTVTEDSIENVEIEFEVEDSWLEENGVGKQNIALFRYVGDEWQQLETELVSSTNLVAHYKATTSAFSYFTIGVTEEKIATTTSPTEVTQPSEVEMEETETIGETMEKVTSERSGNTGLVVSGIILLAIFVFIYWFYTKKKRS